jgi:hypothetical protein
MDGGERRKEREEEERRREAFRLREPQISHDRAGAVHQQLEPVIQLRTFPPLCCPRGHDVSINVSRSRDREEGKSRERAGTLKPFPWGYGMQIAVSRPAGLKSVLGS